MIILRTMFRQTDRLICLMSCLLIAQASAAEISSSRQNELLYFLKHDCGSCHGLTLKGGLGPALLPETLAGKPESYLTTTILEGRENTAMPPWNTMLTYDEASWISKQLKNGSLMKTEIANSNDIDDQIIKGKQ